MSIFKCQLLLPKSKAFETIEAPLFFSKSVLSSAKLIMVSNYGSLVSRILLMLPLSLMMLALGLQLLSSMSFFTSSLLIPYMNVVSVTADLPSYSLISFTLLFDVTVSSLLIS